jgi:hypothetical protein
MGTIFHRLPDACNAVKDLVSGAQSLLVFEYQLPNWFRVFSPQSHKVGCALLMIWPLLS